MTEIKHIRFISEAYMPQTYFQMVKTDNDEVIEVRLSNRKDSGLLKIREGESLLYETDTGGVPQEFQPNRIQAPKIPWKHENGRWVRIK